MDPYLVLRVIYVSGHVTPYRNGYLIVWPSDVSLSEFTCVCAHFSACQAWVAARRNTMRNLGGAYPRDDGPIPVLC